MVRERNLEGRIRERIIKAREATKREGTLREMFERSSKESYRIYSERWPISRQAMNEYRTKREVTENGEKISLLDVQEGDSLFIPHLYIAFDRPYLQGYSCVIVDGIDRQKWAWIEDVKEIIWKEKDLVVMFNERIPPGDIGIIGGISIETGTWSVCSGLIYETVALEGDGLEIYRLKIDDSSRG